MAGILGVSAIQLSANRYLKCETSGAIEVREGTVDTPGNLLYKIDENGLGSGIKLGTAKSATGTFVDFDVPAGVKRVTIMLRGISTNGTSAITVQLGSSSGITVSGYIGKMSVVPDGSSPITIESVTEFPIANSAATTSFSGFLSIIKTSNTFDYMESGTLARVDSRITCTSAGAMTLPSELTTIRIKTFNGTDTFDAGTINISYEGGL